jgi:hypothetical protein
MPAAAPAANTKKPAMPPPSKDDKAAGGKVGGVKGATPAGPQANAARPGRVGKGAQDKVAAARAGNTADAGGGDRTASASQQRFDRMAVRAKLAVSEPGDAVEREADAVAAKVMRMTEPAKASAASEAAIDPPPKGPAAALATPGAAQGIRRTACPCCDGQAIGPATPGAARDIRRREAAPGSPAGGAQAGADPSGGTHELISRLGPGEPLDGDTLTYFEPRMGCTLAAVRIHTDPAAAQSAAQIRARAFTYGHHIAFASGEYQPQSASGKRLIAHELAHVVQQRGTPAGSSPTIQRQPAEPEPFRLDAPDPAAPVSWAEPRAPEPENVSWGELPPAPDVAEGPVCRPEADLVCGREGDPEPLGPAIEFEDVVFAANADYLDWLLRREVRLFGLDETAKLVDRFLRKYAVLPTPVMSAAASNQATSDMARALRGLQERLWGEIPLAVYDAFHRVKQEVSTYLTTYERAAEATLLTLLARSEARVDAERIRYGLQSKEDILHYWSPLRLDAEMRKDPMPEDAVPALKELAAAAGILWGLKLQLELTRAQTTTLRLQSAATILGTHDIGAFQAAYVTYSEQTEHIVDKARLYEFQKAELTERYPVLAAYESDNAKLQLLASGAPVKVLVELHDKMYKILTNIASVREEVNDHDVNIWKLPRLISATNLSLGIQADSLEDALIKQKVQDENDEGFWTSIGLAVAQVVLVLLAPVTGGLTLIPAAAISAGMLVKSVGEYRQQSALAGTDFDRALAIAAEEPSLFWVAMDVVLFIPDAFAALKAFRTIKTLLAEYRAAKSVDEAAEVLGRLERAAAADGGETFAQRMVGGAQAGRHTGLQNLFSAADAEALEAAGEAAARAVTGPVLFERMTVAGTLKITEGGHMVLCSSPCRWLRDLFATALTQSADLEARLARIEQEVQWALARADHASVAALGIQTQTLMRDLVKETVGDLPLNRAQLTVLKDIESVLDSRGLDWTDLGFRDRSELVEVLNTPGRADDVLARLRQRAETAGPRAPAVADAQTRVTSRTIAVERDIDELIEPARPRMDAPPPSVTEPEDLVLWEQYNAYFDERVASMRTDLQRLGWTERMPPHGFDRFRQVYTEHPELLDALRGRLAQGRTGKVLDDITSGTAAQNLGISKVENPVPGEVVYADFVVQRAKGGYSAISNKSRVIAESTTWDELWRIVRNDIREGLEKYYGPRYVRRPGLDVTGERIRIDELVLNYDLNQVPERFRKRMRKMAEAYENVDVKIGFFNETAGTAL